MRKIIDPFNGLRHLLVALLLNVCLLPAVHAGNRTGEGIVVATTGEVTARYPAGSVHDGRYDSQHLAAGLSVGERTVITTSDDGHACIVLTPGALLHVPPNTRLEIQQLRHSAAGLPRSEADLQRQIVIKLDQGRIYVNGGVPTPSLQLVVETPVGRIDGQGGIFSVAGEEDGGWSVLNHDYEFIVVPKSGDRVPFGPGDAGRMREQQVEPEQALADAGQHQFRLCDGYFRDMESFRHHLLGYDAGAVADYLGIEGQTLYVGVEGAVADVSPSFRAPAATSVNVPATPPAATPDGRRWEDRRIWTWWDNIGVVRGVNYVPSYAVNSTEMWMEESFDPDMIDRELGWAQSLGFTSVRVPLQVLVWQDDADGFLDRLDALLDLADRNGLTVVPILFDDLNLAGRDPALGAQPDPVEGQHNTQWTPSPGPGVVRDQAQWADLEDFVRDIVRTFQRDRRILYWDLYNTAGNSDLWEQSLPFMDQVFNWVRDIDPSQPLAVPAWREFGSPMAARKLERSDIVTFHSFEHPELLEAKIKLLKRYNRPIVVSDWLMRQQGNTFEEVLPVYATHGVGWFSRGLVQGRTQMWVQQSEFRNEDEPTVWQHDLLTPDGEPYDPQEIELIRGFRYLEGQ
jgi:hypothetical protein